MVETVLDGADLTPSSAKPASLASAFLQAADFNGTKLGGANLVGAVITNVRGRIPQQYYDENGDLTPMEPMPYPAGAFPLTSCFDDGTTCPNGLTFAANTSQKKTLAQMMALKNPPTSWSPPFKHPLDSDGGHPRRHRPARPRDDDGRRENPGRPDSVGRPDRGREEHRSTRRSPEREGR